MTREEAIKELSVEYLGDSERMIKAKKMAIKALEQEPCDDVISRQALLNYLDETIKAEKKHAYHSIDDAPKARIDMCERVKLKIDALPPVTPKYTDEEIDRAQAVEQAYVDKMVELSVDSALDKIKAEIKHFMFDINPSSSESDYACNYMLDIINKYKAESEE